MSASKCYLCGGGVLSVIAIGLMVGEIRPYKRASAALPGPVPDVEVLRVQQQETRTSHADDVRFAILNCICPKCGGVIELETSELKCLGRCGKRWRDSMKIKELIDKITIKGGRLPRSIVFDSITDLSQALLRAKGAHSEFERGLGAKDYNWPLWYAAYIAMEQGLAEKSASNRRIG